jgi:hypothetical protein
LTRNDALLWAYLSLVGTWSQIGLAQVPSKRDPRPTQRYADFRLIGIAALVGLNALAGCTTVSTSDHRPGLAPAISATLFDSDSCLSYHAIYIFDDGALRYTALERTRTVGSTLSQRTVEERYHKLTTRSMRELKDLVRSFRLAQTLDADPWSIFHSPNAPYETADPVEVQRFRDALSQAAHIRWAAMAANHPPSTCQGESRLWLRGDLWKRSKR